ncbi:MAG TPA: nucleotidyltransferase domain-containing protein, partial [Candidatus Goldiibacteriota bacterium]|nr:nucleotidyltransferase domain-containing protein [Candidatus Goldiibacteriota bacterium]
YLYGSVASGQEKPDSDIDLLIVVKDEEAANEIEPLLERLEKRCLMLYGNPLSPYILTQKEFMAKKGLPVIKNAMKGIKII